MLRILLVLSLCSGLASAQITGSAHDFSGESWNTSRELCKVCHIPHLADSSAPPQPLLWSHEVTTATFELYTSTTLRAQPEQPRGPSRMCLGCHDGTVALDAFAGAMGSTYIQGPAKITTVLTASHPISIDWTHKGVRTCSGCHFVHGQVFASPVPFYEGRVECPTCHEPHGITPRNPDGQHLLRLTMDQSTLCLVCHHK